MDHSEFHGSQKIDRQFVEAGDDGAAFFQPADAAFDDIALPIGGFVKRQRAAPMPLALIFPLRNNRLNVMLSQPGPNGGVAVAFVPGQSMGPSPWPAHRLGNTHRIERGLKLGALLPLPGTHMGG